MTYSYQGQTSSGLDEVGIPGKGVDHPQTNPMKETVGAGATHVQF